MNTNPRRKTFMTLGIVLLTSVCAAPAAAPSASPTPTASLAAAASATPTPTPTPKPTRTPIPTLAEAMTRFKGIVTDASTGTPLDDVCVIIGPPVDCLDNFPHTDDKGFWLVDLPVGGGSLTWTFNFYKAGYELTIKHGASAAPGEQTMDVQLPKK